MDSFPVTQSHGKVDATYPSESGITELIFLAGPGVIFQAPVMPATSFVKAWRFSRFFCGQIKKEDVKQ
jgi:hypothetical protein